MSEKPIPIIVGATASGKTSFSLKVANEISAEIINADSLQVYKDLQILSARPSIQEQNNIPHYLYGYMDAYTVCSVADWLNDVKETIKKVENPIFVGGTGLYIKSLVDGISQMPDIPTEIRELVRNMPIEEVERKVKGCNATDPQRLRRAFEVQLATNKTIDYFQQQPKIKITNKEFQIFFLNPDRETLYNRCNQRFKTMLETGAIDEVKHLKKINATGGVLKAIGVREISKWLDGELSKEDLIRIATQETRHYAKRQITWFKNQFKNAVIFEPKDEIEIMKNHIIK